MKQLPTRDQMTQMISTIVYRTTAMFPTIASIYLTLIHCLKRHSNKSYDTAIIIDKIQIENKTFIIR